MIKEGSKNHLMLIAIAIFALSFYVYLQKLNPRKYNGEYYARTNFSTLQDEFVVKVQKCRMYRGSWMLINDSISINMRGTEELRQKTSHSCPEIGTVVSKKTNKRYIEFLYSNNMKQSMKCFD